MTETNESEKESVKQALGRLQPGAFWKVLATCTGLLIAAASFGGYVNNLFTQTTLNKKETEVARLQREIESLSDDVAALKSAREQADLEMLMLESKAEYMNRHLAFLISKDSTAKSLFVNYVCALWRDAQRRRINISTSPRIRAAEIDRGLSPEVVKLLEKNGISTIRGPDIGKQISVERQLSQLAITKNISFGDGSSFEVPREVSAVVHTREDCRP